MKTQPEHYAKYPCMLPFVGSKYTSSQHKKLMIVGESHYLRSVSGIHKDPASWYAASEKNLIKDDLNMISTSQLIEEGKFDGFAAKAHVIYREVARQMNAVGLGLPDFKLAIDHCLFMNYFQRPAETTGGSICVSDLDERIARITFRWVYETHNPDIILFVSKKAAKFAKVRDELRDISINETQHPGCKWWNKSSRPNGGLSGKERLSKILIDEKWLISNRFHSNFPP